MGVEFVIVHGRTRAVRIFFPKKFFSLEYYFIFPRTELQDTSTVAPEPREDVPRDMAFFVAIPVSS